MLQQENLHYKMIIKSFIIILFLINICHGYDNYSSYYNNYDSDLLTTSISSYPQRYINDLGHEWSIESFMGGGYWRGGAWGSKNGISNYYGVVYYSYDMYHSYNIYNCQESTSETIPEPSSLILLIGFSFLFRKKLLKID